MQAPLKKTKFMYLPIDGYFGLDILCMFNAIKLLYSIILHMKNTLSIADFAFP